MHSLIIDIRTLSLASQAPTTEMLLFVGNKGLRTSNNTRIPDIFHRLGSTDTSDEEPAPKPSQFRPPAATRCEGDVDALATEFLARQQARPITRSRLS